MASNKILIFGFQRGRASSWAWPSACPPSTRRSWTSPASWRRRRPKRRSVPRSRGAPRAT
eukprot:9345009-Pyramimonas_sp.AAC.1